MLRSAGPAFLLGLLRRSNIPNHNIVLSIWMQSWVEEQQFSTAERPSAQSSSATAARTRERLPTPSSTRRLKKDSRNFNYAPYTSPHAASRSGRRAGCPPKGLKPNTSRSRKAKGEPPFYFLCLYSQCPSAPSIPKLTVVVKPGYRISPGHFLGQPQSGFLGGQVGKSHVQEAGSKERDSLKDSERSASIPVHHTTFLQSPTPATLSPRAGPALTHSHQGSEGTSGAATGKLQHMLCGQILE